MVQLPVPKLSYGQETKQNGYAATHNNLIHTVNQLTSL